MKTSIETWYIADDGTRFKDQKKAELHESLCNAINIVMAALKPRPADPGCNFVNGKGYVQQDASAVMRARELLVKLTYNEKHMVEWMDKNESHLLTCDVGWFMRLLDGSCDPLERAWQRLGCINTTSFREYGQPYYATHESEATK